MSDQEKTKPVKAARVRKIQVIMAKNYQPEGDEYKVFTDKMGRLPKGQMVELPKKLAESLIAQNIAARA